MTDKPKFTPVPEGSTIKMGFDPKTRDLLYVKVDKPGPKRLRELLYELQRTARDPETLVVGFADTVAASIDEALDILAALHPAKYAVNDRPITLGEFYEGHGPDDPPGRYYTYDDEPGKTHWMSNGAMKIRMKEIEQ